MIRTLAAGIFAVATPLAAADTPSVASGRFDVKLTPTSAADAPIGTMTLTKTFHGDIEGTSIGTMLAVQTATEGSAGYVAMERVTATIAGRHGTFALQHSGTLDRGRQALGISVVADSATGALTGLSGTMTIDQSRGDHAYTFRYVLPPPR